MNRQYSVSVEDGTQAGQLIKLLQCRQQKTEGLKLPRKYSPHHYITSSLLPLIQSRMETYLHWILTQPDECHSRYKLVRPNNVFAIFYYPLLVRLCELWFSATVSHLLPFVSCVLCSEMFFSMPGHNKSLFELLLFSLFLSAGSSEANLIWPLPLTRHFHPENFHPLFSLFFLLTNLCKTFSGCWLLKSSSNPISNAWKTQTRPTSINKNAPVT